MPEEKVNRIQRRLDDKEFKLNLLLDITQQINNNAPSSVLYDYYEYTLRNQLGINKAMLYMHNGDSWECVIKYGAKGLAKNIKPEADFAPYEKITIVASSVKKHLNWITVIIPVRHKDTALAYLLIGDDEDDNDSPEPTSIDPHLNFIQTMTNIITVAIENKRMAKVEQERAARDVELKLAKEMQKMLFPHQSELPNNKFLEIGAHYQPHLDVGGDYYDYIKLNHEEVLFCLADVSGKGVSAALLVANFQANLRALATYKSSLLDLVYELNEKVNHSAKGEKFITLFIAKYNVRTRALNYVNAAHNPPLLYDGTEFNKLNTGCTGLGMFEHLPSLKEGIVIIPPNGLLFCYTDGVTELENNKSAAFGTSGLKGFLADHGSRPCEEINADLMAVLEEYREEQSYLDDIALFTCRFK